MSSTRLKHWSERTRGVRLSPFVEACVRLGADPVHVAFGPSERDSDPRWSPWGGPSRPWPALRPIPRSASYRQSRAARWRDVGRQLDRLLDVGTPPPLRETARDLGVGLDALQHNLPDHYRRLVSKRAARFSVPRERARQALDRAISGVEPRSLNAVAEAVSVSHTMIRKWFPDRCANLIRLHAERAALARNKVLAERCRAVSEAVPALRASGGSPSLYRALRFAGLPDALLSNTAIRAAWLRASDPDPHCFPTPDG